MQDQEYQNLSIDEFNALFAKPDEDTSNDLLSEPNINTSIEEEPKEKEMKKDEEN